jgi:hypothetical protein
LSASRDNQEEVVLLSLKGQEALEESMLLWCGAQSNVYCLLGETMSAELVEKLHEIMSKIAVPVSIGL